MGYKLLTVGLEIVNIFCFRFIQVICVVSRAYKWVAWEHNNGFLTTLHKQSRTWIK